MKTINIKSIDNYMLTLDIYEIENPIAYVQIIHGMQEYKDRYTYFANKLNEAGYSVVVSDIRGHGKSAPTLGYFAENNGYQLVLEDQKLITKYIKETYNTENIIIFGHSMGSIITRNLLQTESNNYSKIVLSGYPNYQPASKLGIILAKIIKKFKGGKYNSKLLSDISVGSFNKKIKNPRTNLDWLSYNTENVDNYIENPYCGHQFLTSAFQDLFTLLGNMSKVKKFINVKSIPLLLLYGDSDPCVGGEKGSNHSINTLNKAGFTNIIKIKYEHMRHEILNEDNKDAVISDIINFLK